MKKFWKIVATVTAVVLAGCITLTSVMLLSEREKIEAGEYLSFKGVESIAERAKTDPFVIWELVPEVGMGEFAHMYDEKALTDENRQEALKNNWQEALKTILKRNTEDGKIGRVDYMQALADKWYGLYNCANGNEKYQALQYQAYEEQYALDRDDTGDSYKVMELAGSVDRKNCDVLLKNSTEYYLLFEEGKAGEYRRERFYSIVEENGEYSGDYVQDVDYFVYSQNNNAYYGVPFEGVKKEELKEIEGEYFVPDGEKLYEVANAYYIADEDTYNEILKKNKNTYVYRLSYSQVYGAFEYVNKISEIPYSTIEDGVGNYYYYTVSFKYKDVQPNESLSENTNYYRIQSDSVPEFLAEKDAEGNYIGVGEYAANIGAEYKPVDSGKGYFKKTDEDCFVYVGKDKGTHNLVKARNGESLEEDVIPGKIYYKGGFTNNRLMEKYVFGADYDTLKFDYREITPNAEAEWVKDLDNVDLLYISSKSLTYEKETGTEGPKFDKDHDISWEMALKIWGLAKQEGKRLPIIVDRSIINTNDVKNYAGNAYTNLQRLVALLASKEYKDPEEELDGEEINENTTVSGIKWGELTYQTNHSYGYVNNNIYVYPGNIKDSSIGTPFIFKEFSTYEIAKGTTADEFLTKARQTGFGEIAEYINEENLKREIENNGLDNKLNPFPCSITKATVVEYILNFGSREKKALKTSLNILEIQPGGTEGNNPTLSADTIKAKLKEKNYEVDEVKITFMTTSEFVGKIEELSKYDMIYFGLDTFAFSKENGSTVYNDADMNGLIYSNIGDIIAFQESYFKGTPGFTGLLESDYYHKAGERYAIKLIDGSGKIRNTNAAGNSDEVISPSEEEKKADNFISPDKTDMSKYKIADNTYRFSGNDISKGKLEDVCDYVKAGHPVLVDNGFFSNIAKREIDKSKIDNCSYMYELMDKIKGKENVFAFNKNDIGKTDLDKVMQYITNGKPEITILPHTLADYHSDSSKYDFFDVKNNTITLEFQLTNHGAASDKSAFVCALYLDANADGKFSKTQEKISATEIRMTKDGNILKPIGRNGADNKTEYYYEIEPGTSYHYQMSYELPTGTIGLIPWKLEVSQSDNLLRSVSEDGFFYNKNQGENKTEINILQINTASESKYTNNFNMEAQWNNVNSAFHKYVAAVPDFKLKIKTIPSDQFGGLDDNCPKENVYTGYEFFDTCVDGKPADMLVIGFADMFLIENNNGCMDGIVQFINEGNPVLFTHDTTSFYNNSLYDYPLYARYPVNNDKEGEAGYEFNTKIRNLVGMDRYGVLTNTVLKEGKPLSSVSSDESVKAKFKEAIAQSVSSNVDIGYVPKSDKKELAKQIQGFAYGFMTYRAAGAPNYINYLPYGMSFGEGKNWDKQIATKVEQVNSGQITNYPYKIPKSFKPSDTHFQYYQLDLNEDEDKDGESDIVVWYTLGADNTVYSGTPRDVRNNYYIYTKGNVTYSGVGHSPVTTDEEIKLYINTMIAAYHSGINPAQLSLRTGEAEDADPMNVMYIAFDRTIQEKGDGSKELVESTESIEQSEELNKSEKGNTVYFTVTDKNIIKNLESETVEMTFGIYLTDKEEEYNKLSEQEKGKCMPWTEGDKTIYLKTFEPTITNVNGEEDKVKTTGVTYKAVIPPDILGKDQNHATVYVIAKVKITQKFIQYVNNQPEPVSKVMEVIAVETFRVQRIGLMDLD